MQIFCIHHQNNNIGTYEQMKLINDTANNLQILQSHTQIAPPTPPNITVNPSKNGLIQTTQIHSHTIISLPHNFQTTILIYR
jgi:hypothetical protein